MTDPNAETTLLKMLDRRQDEVLEGLDQLHERVLATIKDWTVSSIEEAATEGPDAAKAPCIPNSEAA